jgi:hypothetical protein
MNDELDLEQVEKEIEISIEAAKGAVERKNQMVELLNDKRFQNLFTIGYMEREPARLTSLLADSDWQTEEKQQSIIEDLRAISSLRQYILGIKAIGNQMEKQIANSERQLDEMRIEAEGE